MSERLKKQINVSPAINQTVNKLHPCTCH